MLMKGKLLALILIIGLSASTFAGRHHRSGGDQAAPQQRVQSPAVSQPASARLAQFTAAYLDHILAPIDENVLLPRTELGQLRAEFLDRMMKAPDPEKPQYQAAVAVCDALTSAMDERDKA